MKEDQSNPNLEERVLGHLLSQEQMALISGGVAKTTTLPPVQCTPTIDGVGE